jgi:hypothetical protein
VAPFDRASAATATKGRKKTGYLLARLSREARIRFISRRRGLAGRQLRRWEGETNANPAFRNEKRQNPG